jgi:PAS domain S-box-containing protein
MMETDELRARLDVHERLLLDQTAETRNAETLARVMEALYGSDVLTEGISRTMDICRQVPGADLIVFLRPSGEREMETVAASDTRFGLPRWKVLAEQMCALGWVRDLQASTLHQSLPCLTREYRSLVSVPVIDDQQLQMILVALNVDAERYTRHDIALLTQIGNLIGRALYCQRAKSRVVALETILIESEEKQPDHAGPDKSINALSRAFNRQEEWQRRILQLTDDLLSAPCEDVDPAINHALEVLGKLSESDRTYVFRRCAPDRLDNTHEWVAPGIEPMIDVLQDLDDSLMDEWLPTFNAGKPVYIADVDELPDGLPARDILKMQGIKSLLAAPMLGAGQITGFVGYDAVKERRKFLSGELRLLLSITNTITAVIDRKAAEIRARTSTVALEAESSRLRATLTAIPDILLTVDVDGRFTDFNFGSATMPLYAPEDFLGRLVEEVLPPETAAYCRLIMHELDEKGQCEIREYPMSTPDGERWYSVSAGALLNKEHRGGYVFLIRDVSNRHEQERRIRQLGRIAELTSNLVVVTNPVGAVDWVNPAFVARSGWSLDELRGRDPRDFLMMDETGAATVADIRAMLLDHQPLRKELQNRSRSGEEYWVMADIQPLLDERGKLEGFVSIQTDITEMKASHQHEQRLRNTAIETASDGMSISGSDGRFRYMNPAHRRMFGIPLGEDIRNLTHDDMMPPGQAQEMRKTSLPVLLAERRWRGPIMGLHRDGHILELDITTTLISDEEMVSVVRDVTAANRAAEERARLQEELQAAERRETVSHVASGVAHDLSNLVAVVSGTVSVLQNPKARQTEIRNGLQRIDRAMMAARDLVRGLADLGRPSAPRELIDLRSIIVEAVDLLGTNRVRRYAIHTQLPSTTQSVIANRTELLQVIVNLALNACEAEGDHPNVVTMRVFPENSPVPQRAPDTGVIDRRRRYCLFSVSDTGTGIMDELRARLFERYVTTKGARGTGLGLPIVATILSNNGAALWVDSVRGEGTTMTIAWGLEEAPQPQEQPTTVEAMGSVQLNGLQIMVVDDNIDAADVLSEVLEANGAVTVTLSDPVEARHLLVKKPRLWSLLVTDHDMPVMTGTDLAKVAAECSPPVPCVLVTALQAGSGWTPDLFAAVLPKPLDTSVLLNTVQMIAPKPLKAERKIS